MPGVALGREHVARPAVAWSTRRGVRLADELARTLPGDVRAAGPGTVRPGTAASAPRRAPAGARRGSSHLRRVSQARRRSGGDRRRPGVDLRVDGPQLVERQTAVGGVIGAGRRTAGDHRMCRPLRRSPGAGDGRGGRGPRPRGRRVRRGRPRRRFGRAVLHRAERVVDRRRPPGRAAPGGGREHAARPASGCGAGSWLPGGGCCARRASRRPNRRRPRDARRRHRPLRRGGRRVRHGVRAGPAWAHAALGGRAGGRPRSVRRRRADPPITGRPAIDRAGGRRALVRHGAARQRVRGAAPRSTRC